ncbi:dihydroorotate dehydrogenase electron transfer subunit [Salirhabdus euzebyi]|uniref:Dihydroorotate dehydrogenase B (NAD(+)), electron transfer subunit n=1 Tax=Salirhabdus euzebyi TaxID=394506 RepID=A0A841Q3M7_9BACI|nr:dihydroorotate dehydrogenase electron transfer subunit [Salirhabdus euzebyi]MBB6452987.1 dihydroorotate dehydrogenase electron transfer subunit [Salirhabdus euzebyi]
MIKEQWMTVVKNRHLALDTYEMILTGELTEKMINPGQFLHLKIGEGFSHMLRRPISITNVDIDHQEVTIIYKTIGSGTSWLSKQTPGEKIHVLGPRGNGFPIEQVTNKKLLVIGGGVGVPPLYYLTKKLVEQQNEVTAILGFQTKDAVFYEDNFKKLAKTFIVTDDGTKGEKGRVTNLIPSLQGDVDYYYSCGPTAMLHAVSNEMKHVPGYISLEERMGCGIGACFACVCKTVDETDEKGYRKICMDGPVFQSNEVIL